MKVFFKCGRREGPCGTSCIEFVDIPNPNGGTLRVASFCGYAEYDYKM